ncbi:MAG: DUF1294 domain-containing protein [Bacteroidaceae bacterium]|nr:DUF1294 domain-containing protein [Bacteroidaceae bacterium]
MLALIIYALLALNLITFIIYGIDKHKAKKAKWRIPESTLILLALIGGSIGAWLGIKAWRHKTQHPKFYIGIPLIITGQIILLIYLIKAYT